MSSTVNSISKLTVNSISKNIQCSCMPPKKAVVKVMAYSFWNTKTRRNYPEIISSLPRYSSIQYLIHRTIFILFWNKFNIRKIEVMRWCVQIIVEKRWCCCKKQDFERNCEKISVVSLFFMILSLYPNIIYLLTDNGAWWIQIFLFKFISYKVWHGNLVFLIYGFCSNIILLLK